MVVVCCLVVSLLLSLLLLSCFVTSHCSSIICSSAPSLSLLCCNHLGVRGPLSGRGDGSWRSKFVSALRPEAGIAAVASSVSCQLVPHMQTHMYAVSTLVVPFLTAYELTISDAERHNRIAYVAHVEVGMSQMLFHAGFKIAHLGAGAESWEGKCTGPGVRYDNPVTWCEMDPAASVFVKFGGEAMRDKLMCAKAIDNISAVTQGLIDSNPDKKIVAVWPEVSPYAH
jgi:hypothetical protein